MIQKRKRITFTARRRSARALIGAADLHKTIENCATCADIAKMMLHARHEQPLFNEGLKHGNCSEIRDLIFRFDSAVRAHFLRCKKGSQIAIPTLNSIKKNFRKSGR